MLSRTSIENVDKLARERFTYKADPVLKDTWRSHAKQVLAGEAWSGDCDDLASTVLDLLGRNGVALEDRYRLYVASDKSDTVDHMVAAVRANDGDIYVVGDTFAPIYKLNRMAHRLLGSEKLSGLGNVYTGGLL